MKMNYVIVSDEHARGLFPSRPNLLAAARKMLEATKGPVLVQIDGRTYEVRPIDNAPDLIPAALPSRDVVARDGMPPAWRRE